MAERVATKCDFENRDIMGTNADVIVYNTTDVLPGDLTLRFNPQLFQEHFRFNAAEMEVKCISFFLHVNYFFAQLGSKLAWHYNYRVWTPEVQSILCFQFSEAHHHCGILRVPPSPP